MVPSSGSGDDGGHERSQTCAGLTDVLLDTTPGTSQDESTTNTIQASGVFTDFDSMVGRNFPEGVFATGSKDHTIAIWDLFADSFTL